MGKPTTAAAKNALTRTEAENGDTATSVVSNPPSATSRRPSVLRPLPSEAFSSQLSTQNSAANLVRGGDRSADIVAFEIEVVSFFMDAAGILGVPKSVAAIYGLCFASPGPLSFADLNERLEISQGSISQGIGEPAQGREDEIADDEGSNAFWAEWGGKGTQSSPQVFTKLARPKPGVSSLNTRRFWISAEALIARGKSKKQSEVDRGRAVAELWQTSAEIRLCSCWFANRSSAS